MGLTDLDLPALGLGHLILDVHAPDHLAGLPVQGALFGWDKLPDRMPAFPSDPGAALFSPCRSYRYALTRTWNPTKPPAVFVMLNPSTADAFLLDATVRRCMAFAGRWGCGGLLVLNLFALRSTDPSGLRCPDPVGPDNDTVIEQVLAAARNLGPVTVAWGAHETLRRTGRDLLILAMLNAAGIQPQCLRLTKDGYPGHPLYVPANTQPVPYPETAGAH